MIRVRKIDHVKIRIIVLFNDFHFLFTALVNCEYYFTSENEFRDKIPLAEIANTSNPGLAYQLQFFVLVENSIKFVLGKDGLPLPTPPPPQRRSHSSPFDDFYQQENTTPTESEPEDPNIYKTFSYDFGKYECSTVWKINSLSNFFI